MFWELSSLRTYVSNIPEYFVVIGNTIGLFIHVLNISYQLLAYDAPFMAYNLFNVPRHLFNL